MNSDLESALDELGLRYRRFGPFAVLSFDCGLASYDLSVPVDLRVSHGLLVGRAFLFGPVVRDRGEAVARYVAFASSQLVGTKLVLVEGNVLVQAEENLRASLRDVADELIGRLLSAAQLVALEVVAVATDLTVHRVVLDLLLATSDTSTLATEEGSEALAELADTPANPAHVALSRRGPEPEPDDAPRSQIALRQQVRTD